MREKPLHKANINPDELLGEGYEKKVFNDPENEKKVVGVFKPNVVLELNEHLMTARFYFTKILHILFPDNIPDWHHAEIKANAYVADKVIIDDKRTKDRDAKEVMRDKSIFFQKLSAIIDEGEYHLGNFCVDTKGNLVFLDSFNPWVLYSNDIRQYFSDKKLHAAIAAIPDQLKRQEAENYYARLLVLRDTEFEKFRSKKKFL